MVPLKIAKATLLNMTATSSVTNLVTVSDNLYTMDIVAGARFIRYNYRWINCRHYILCFASCSRNTFSVSATQLSVNVNSIPSINYIICPSTLSVNLRDSGCKFRYCCSVRWNF